MFEPYDGGYRDVSFNAHEAGAKRPAKGEMTDMVYDPHGNLRRVFEYDVMYIRPQSLPFACNLGNFPRPLALPKPLKKRSPRTLRKDLIRIEARVAGHSRHVPYTQAYRSCW